LINLTTELQLLLRNSYTRVRNKRDMELNTKAVKMLRFSADQDVDTANCNNK